MNKQMLVPRLNANDNKVSIAHWYVAHGDFVRAGQDLVDLGTSKATVAVQSTEEGYVQILHPAGTKADVGSPLAKFFPKADKVPASPAGAAKPLPSENLGETRFSRSALAYMEQNGLKKEDYRNRGLVTLDILLGKEAEPAGSAPAMRIGAASLTPVPEGLRMKRPNALKSAEISSLSTGQEGNIVSSLTVQFQAENILKTLRTLGAFNGAILPVIIHEFAKLAREYPNLTAFFANNQTHFYDEVNVGVAIDTGNGLKVVTLKETSQLFPAAIYESLTDFAMRDLRGELVEEDLTGNTVTVTDLSAQNILHFQPLINGRQSAILGIGGDSTLPGHPMSLTLAFDHRVFAGREAAVFLNALKSRLLEYRWETLQS